eukprot:261391_1
MGNSINVPVIFNIQCLKIDCIMVKAKHSDDYTIDNLISDAVAEINKKYKPLQYQLRRLKEPFFWDAESRAKEEHKMLESDKVRIDINSFLECNNPISKKKNKQVSLNTFRIKHLNDIGLRFEGDFVYHHKPNIMIYDNKIKCKYMLKNNNIIDKCPYYKDFTCHHISSEDHLKHFINYQHYTDPKQKIKCRYNDECYSFIRVLNRNDKISDLCHMQIFRHPPRGNRVQNLNNNDLNNDMNQFIYNSSLMQIPPTITDIHMINTKYTANEMLGLLIDEVIKNGFAEDLYITNDVFYDEDDYVEEEKEEEIYCSPEFRGYYNRKKNEKYDTSFDKYTIMSVVHKKMKHKRMKQMKGAIFGFMEAEMLALLLYTGGKCTYSLCKTQRNGDYSTWKYFDYCLFSAIVTLSEAETGDYKLYSGLKNIELNQKRIKNGYFVTYVSSSWDRNVAVGFVQSDTGRGCIFEMTHIRNNRNFACCDVSWISKFTAESEILIARTAPTKNEIFDAPFQCEVVDKQNGIQIISLTPADKSQLQKHEQLIEKQFLKNNLCNFKDTYDTLKHLGFDSAISLNAASNFPHDIDKAVEWISNFEKSLRYGRNNIFAENTKDFDEISENKLQCANISCQICLQSLAKGNVIIVECCGVKLHTDCLMNMIKSKCNNAGRRISLKQLGCLICRNRMKNSKNKALFSEIDKLWDDLQYQVLQKLNVDHEIIRNNLHSEYYCNKAINASEKYLFFVCFQCKKICYEDEKSCCDSVDDEKLEPKLCSICSAPVLGGEFEKALKCMTGHLIWLCPNDHIYFIGNCGATNGTGYCSECKAPIGNKVGQKSHIAATGNRLIGKISKYGHIVPVNPYSTATEGMAELPKQYQGKRDFNKMSRNYRMMQMHDAKWLKHIKAFNDKIPDKKDLYWKCHLCTFVNSNMSASCKICSYTRSWSNRASANNNGNEI